MPFEKKKFSRIDENIKIHIHISVLSNIFFKDNGRGVVHGHHILHINGW